jgi:hypothetical protein
MAARPGRLCVVKVSGEAVAFTDEATTNTGNISYRITNATKRVWASGVSVVVKAAGTPVNPALDPYTINRLAGTVVFDSADAGRGAVTVSGSYLPLTTVGDAKTFSYGLSLGTIPANVFGDTAVASIAGLVDVSGTVGKFTGDSYFTDALLAAEAVVLEFATSGAGPDMRARAVLDADQIQAAVDGAIEESVNFVGATDDEGRSFTLLT